MRTTQVQEGGAGAGLCTMADPPVVLWASSRYLPPGGQALCREEVGLVKALSEAHDVIQDAMMYWC